MIHSTFSSATIRRATKEDAEAIAELEAQLFDNCFNETTIARELEIGYGMVRYDAKSLVSYILWREETDLIDITRLGVRADCRRQGEGEAQLQTALSFAQLKSLPVMLCAYKNNTAALALYRKHGLSIIGELTEYNAWVLATPEFTADA